MPIIQTDNKRASPMAMKLVCAGEEQRVVGLHVIGAGADEMLQGFAVAVRMGATKSDFDHCVALHPTAAEEFVTMAPWGQTKEGKPWLPGSMREQPPIGSGAVSDAADDASAGAAFVPAITFALGVGTAALLKKLADW